MGTRFGPCAADPSCTHGTATYDDIGHHVKWVIDKFPNDKTPCLTVQLQLSNNTPKKGSAEAEAGYGPHAPHTLVPCVE